MNGSDKVDSIAWNPHKMVGAPLQCSPFIVRHKVRDGIQQLHLCSTPGPPAPVQLRQRHLPLPAGEDQAESERHCQDKFYDVSYDTGDKSVQCGRKVDAFKLWFQLKVD
jgi:hypothetical protein